MTNLDIGIDPDLHRTAVALFYSEQHWLIHIIDVGSGIKGREAMRFMASRCGLEIPKLLFPAPASASGAVEGQNFILRGAARFSDIGMLGVVTGAALAALASAQVPALCPMPQEWKGSVPKEIHHARIAARLNFALEMRSGYGLPVDPEVRALLPLASDWKHGMDALGLALWSRDQRIRRSRAA